MSIHVNGKPVPAAAPVTIHDLLGSLDLPRTDIAVAVDGTVVPRSQWPTTNLGPDADVEVVTAMQGG